MIIAVIAGWQGWSNFLIQRENEDKCRKCGGKDDVCQGNYDGGATATTTTAQSHLDNPKTYTDHHSPPESRVTSKYSNNAGGVIWSPIKYWDCKVSPLPHLPHLPRSVWGWWCLELVGSLSTTGDCVDSYSAPLLSAGPPPPPLPSCPENFARIVRILEDSFTYNIRQDGWSVQYPT